VGVPLRRLSMPTTLYFTSVKVNVPTEGVFPFITK
jgi:hypothetical protein